MTIVVRHRRDVDEILARIYQYRDEGWRDPRNDGKAALVRLLPYGLAKAFIPPNAMMSRDFWQATARGPEDLAIGALTRWIGAAKDHDATTASTSRTQTLEYLWAEGRDDVVHAAESLMGGPFGMPTALLVAAVLGGLAWQKWLMVADVNIGRMAAGWPCTPGCENGCL